LHAVKDGPANRSYGLQVAQLAGVPHAVIVQARHYLETLEAERDGGRAAAASGTSTQQQLPLAPPAPRDPLTEELRAALAALDPDTLSPKAALEALYELRALLTKPR
jgi:DNA mismatch repair protein MutS